MRKYILAVVVVTVLGLVVSSCGGKGLKGAKHAARDLRNSVKHQLKRGKHTSSGPLFGRRAYSVPPVPSLNSGTVKIPVVLVSLYDSQTSTRILPNPLNRDPKGYFCSLFSREGDGNWRNLDPLVFPKTWLGSGGFSMRDFYEHNSLGKLNVRGDIITAGLPTVPPDRGWLPIPISYQGPPTTYGALAHVATNADGTINYDGSGSLVKAMGYFLSGKNLELSGTDVSRLSAFLNYIVDWLN